MSITVIIGGQFGSEGKGKMTAHLCCEYKFDLAVRCGGPNSGHTVTVNGEQVALRQIPAGVLNPHTKLFLAPGCLIDLGVLLQEINLFNLTPDRLGIDHKAAIIDEDYGQEEKRMGLGERIGSTCTGTGLAVARRALRVKGSRLARDTTELKPYLRCVSEEIVSFHSSGKKVVIEGTQGFGLSLYHSPYYPYVTSRDTTTSGFLSEAGISPLAVSDILMVIRTFPIRVGGNSGPLPKEINWKIIQQRSGYPYEIREFTSVTKKVRRVAEFDIQIVTKAVSVNMPTQVALMGVDYIDYRNKGVKNYDGLTQQTKNFISWLERKIGIKINFIGTGPTGAEIIDKIKNQEVMRYEKEETRRASTSKRKITTLS